MEQQDYYNYSNLTDHVAKNHTGGEGFAFVIIDIVILFIDVLLTIMMWVTPPLILAAIYFLFLLIREGNVVSVYVLNLLISDLIQNISLFVYIKDDSFDPPILMSRRVHFMGVLASVGFMVCISVERYLVIACPLWYRFKRNVKISVVVCILVWALSLAELLISILLDDRSQFIFCCIVLLLPFPVFIFSLVGSLKALSRAIAVPPQEKDSIIGTLVAVLLIYTFLFLPTVIKFVYLSLKPFTSDDYTPYVNDFTLLFLMFSPTADLVLYVMMRRGAADRLLSHPRCCRTAKDEAAPNTTIQTSLDPVSSVETQQQNQIITLQDQIITSDDIITSDNQIITSEDQ